MAYVDANGFKEPPRSAFETQNWQTKVMRAIGILLLILIPIVSIVGIVLAALG